MFNKQKKIQKKILITGSKGQLASEFKKCKKKDNINFIFADKQKLDISKITQLINFLKKHHVDIIINCASYNDVDKAEKDRANAFRTNEKGVNNLINISKKFNLILIHISTDYVFDGKSIVPYTEKDKVCPLSIYAKSKVAGEKAFLKLKPKGIIIRTSWLYSSFGSNFVKQIIKLSLKKEILEVVNDQFGTPTYARDLAQAIIIIISSKKFNTACNNCEIFHFSNQGKCTWYEFAKFITKYKKINCKLIPIKYKKLKRKTRRPKSTILSKKKIMNAFNLKINNWKSSLINCLKLIK